MIPIFQTIIDVAEGNCFPACLASLLELPLDSIPHFLKEYGRTNMMKEARKWLSEKYGLTILTIEAQRGAIPIYAYVRPLHAEALCMVSGYSHTFEQPASHVVVGRIINDIFDYELVHDPNPSGKGINGDPLYFYFLMPIDPVRCIYPEYGIKAAINI